MRACWIHSFSHFGALVSGHLFEVGLLLTVGSCLPVGGTPQTARSASNAQEIFDRLVYTRELPGNATKPDVSSHDTSDHTSAAPTGGLDVQFLRIDHSRTEQVDARDLKPGMAFRLRITTKADGFLYIVQDDPRSRAPALVYPYYNGHPPMTVFQSGRHLLPEIPNVFRLEKDSGPTNVFIVVSKTKINARPQPGTVRRFLLDAVGAGILAIREVHIGYP
jgi:hypothetical protein